MVAQNRSGLRSTGINAQRDRDILAEVQREGAAAYPCRFRRRGISQIKTGFGTIGNDAHIEHTVQVVRKGLIEDGQVITHIGGIVDRIVCTQTGIRIVTPVGFAHVIGEEQPFGFIRGDQPYTAAGSGSGLSTLCFLEHTSGLNHQRFVRCSGKGRHSYQGKTTPVTSVITLTIVIAGHR